MSPLQRSSIKYLPQIISSSRGALPAPLGEPRMQESLMRPASVAALPPRSLTIHHPGDGSRKSAAVNVACTGGRVPELKHFLWICARIRVCLLRRSRSRNFDPRVEAVNEGVQQELGLFFFLQKQPQLSQNQRFPVVFLALLTPKKVDPSSGNFSERITWKEMLVRVRTTGTGRSRSLRFRFSLQSLL